MGMMDNPSASIAEKVIAEYQMREAARSRGVVEIDGSGRKSKTPEEKFGAVSDSIVDGLKVLFNCVEVADKVRGQTGEEEDKI